MKCKPEMVCTVDSKNLLKQDTAGVFTVKLVKKIKKRPLGKSVWLCENLEAYSNVKTLQVQEKLLEPANMALFRFPTNAPVINSTELQDLMSVIQSMESDNSRSLDRIKKSLKGLYEKLKFYYESRDV